jgi:hypothetical protein
MLACKNSGFEFGDHFADISKTIEMPKTAKNKSLITNLPDTPVTS